MTASEEYAQAEREMQDRMARYVRAWNEGDLTTVLSYFSDTDLDYTDYGLMALHLDKKALTSYYQSMGSLFGDMNIRTTSVRGAIDFCVWECVFEFTVLQDHPDIPYKKGERGKLFSASVIEWRRDKIVKETDYAVWATKPDQA